MTTSNPDLIDPLKLGLLWLAALLLMTGHVAGVHLFGWPSDGPLWYAALAALVSLNLVTLAEHAYRRWNDTLTEVLNGGR